MFEMLILLSLTGVIAAISAIIGERKKYLRAKRKWERFEEMHPKNQE